MQDLSPEISSVDPPSFPLKEWPETSLLVIFPFHISLRTSCKKDAKLYKNAEVQVALKNIEQNIISRRHNKMVSSSFKFYIPPPQLQEQQMLMVLQTQFELLVTYAPSQKARSQKWNRPFAYDICQEVYPLGNNMNQRQG